MTRFDPATDAGLDALLGAAGLPAGARPRTSASSIRARAARRPPPPSPVLPALALFAVVLAALVGPLAPRMIPTSGPSPATPTAVQLRAPAATVAIDPPLPATLATAPPLASFASAPARVPPESLAGPLPAADERTLPVLDPAAPAPALTAEIAAPSPPERSAPSAPPSTRVAMFVAGGVATDFGVSKGPPVGPGLRGGLRVRGPGTASPLVGLTGEVVVLPDPLGPDRFSGGLEGAGGVSLGAPAARLDLAWTAGLRGMPDVPSTPQRWVLPGGAFVATGPAVAASFGRDGPRLRVGLAVQARLRLRADGPPTISPWVSATVGLELPVAP